MKLRTIQMMIYDEILFSRSIGFFLSSIAFENRSNDKLAVDRVGHIFQKVEFPTQYPTMIPQKFANSKFWKIWPTLVIYSALSRYVFSYFIQNIFKTYKYSEAWTLLRKSLQKATKWFSKCFSLKLFYNGLNNIAYSELRSN